MYLNLYVYITELTFASYQVMVHQILAYDFLLTPIILSFPEKAKIGEIEYLCHGDECWEICRPLTATCRKNIFGGQVT